MIVEICCGSYEDAMNSYLGGAKRIELNSALNLGGLTPSLGSLTLTKKNTELNVICMVRPRGAGFNYNAIEVEQMMEDAKLLLENGADGIAFGFLRKDHKIDIERTEDMVKLIKSYNKEAVFHRAFDCVNDAVESINQLIDLNIDRILTSGLKEKAFMGKDMIKELQEKFGNKIEILAGSGVNVSNAKELMNYTNISQIHSSCKAWCTDNTTSGEFVNYCYGPKGNENDYDFVSKELVRNLVNG